MARDCLRAVRVSMLLVLRLRAMYDIVIVAGQVVKWTFMSQLSLCRLSSSSNNAIDALSGKCLFRSL